MYRLHCVEQITSLGLVDFCEAAKPSACLLIVAKRVGHTLTITARDLASLKHKINGQGQMYSPSGDKWTKQFAKVAAIHPLVNAVLFYIPSSIQSGIRI